MGSVYIKLGKLLV